MISRKERFIIDEEGNRLGVVLDIDDYKRILHDLEEFEAIRAYDAATTAEDEAIPFEQAIAEIEQSRS